MLLACDDFVEELENAENADTILSAKVPVQSTTVKEPQYHLSLNALKGVNGVCTILFKAKLQGLDIHVLIDGGSSDNFLQPRIDAY